MNKKNINKIDKKAAKKMVIDKKLRDAVTESRYPVVTNFKTESIERSNSSHLI